MKYVVVIIYLLCFGIADCIWVNVNNKNHMLTSMLCRSAVTTLLFICMALVQHFPDSGHEEIGTTAILYAVGISMVCYGGQYFYVRSLKYAPVSISITLVSIITFFVTIVISTTYYDDHIGLPAFTFMLITLAGVYLTVDGLHWESTPKYRVGLRYVLLSAICWGVGYSFIRRPVEAVGVINFSLILETTILCINLFLFCAAGLRWRQLTNVSVQSWKYLIILGTLIFGGTIFNSLSYTYFGVTTLNIVGKVGIVVPIAYALLFLGETVNKKQVVGIITILAGATAVACL